MPDEKVRENRLRRAADRQRLDLVKSRRRDPLAPDHGTYALIDRDGQEILFDDLTLDEVEQQLGSGAEGRNNQAAFDRRHAPYMLAWLRRMAGERSSKPSLDHWHETPEDAAEARARIEDLVRRAAERKGKW